MKIYNIYTVNQYHEHDTRELIGVSTYHEDLGPKVLIQEYISKNNYDHLSQDDIYNLETIKQTQNYTEGFEFLIEQVETDKLL